MTTDHDGWGHPEFGPDVTHVPLNRAPAKKKYKKPEGNIQKDCTEYMERLGFIVLRTNAGVVKTEAGNYFHGIQDGGADLHCCAWGWFLAVETKAPKKGLRADQQAYQAKVEATGGTYIEAHSVAELRAGLVAAYGPQRVEAWEAQGAARVDAKKAVRDALMKKMGQKR